MPQYVVRCPSCGENEITARMSEATVYMPCGFCERPRPQVFFAPQFQEDRVRMWKGPLGNGYSTALGEQMPDSRAARDALAKRKGVEFISKAELIADNKEAAQAIEYRKEVDQGAPKEAAPRVDVTPFVPKPAWAERLT